MMTVGASSSHVANSNVQDVEAEAPTSATAAAAAAVLTLQRLL